MTYDLYGWKRAADCSKSADEILDGLIANGSVSGVEDFPFPAMVEKIKAAFPGVKEEHFPAKDVPVTLDWTPPSGGGFHIEWDSRYLMSIVWFGGDPGDESIVTLMDVAEELGCTLYDPQMEDYLTGDEV